MVSVDTKDILKLTTKLSGIHRAAFPNAVRFTLNDMAFDVKKNTLIPALKSSDMTIRSESFFKRYSGVDKASGWDVNSMQSQVGMIPSGGATVAVNRLQQQEEGGKLEHSFIPDDQARVGGTKRSRIKGRNLHSRMVLRAHIPWNDKQGLIREVTGTRIERGGSGKGNVIIYGSVLYEIKGFKRIRDANTIRLHLRKLYTYQKDRKITVKPQRFMAHSAMKSGAKMQEIFKVNLEKQLVKFAGR